MRCACRRRSYEKVQEISDKVSTRSKQRQSLTRCRLGGRNLDGVVAISESLEASIMATMLCKEMGILRRCKGERQTSGRSCKESERIVSYPEIEMGSRGKKPRVERICGLDLSFQMITVW